MKRFDYAIKAIEQEKLRVIGKYASELAEQKHDPMLALKRSKVMNLTEAIEVLTKHHRNVHT